MKDLETAPLDLDLALKSYDAHFNKNMNCEECFYIYDHLCAVQMERDLYKHVTRLKEENDKLKEENDRLQMELKKNNENGRKMERGFTVGEFDVNGKKGFGLNFVDDLTFNQMACMCAFAIVYAMSYVLDDKNYAEVVEKIRVMMLCKNPEWIQEVYLKACRDAENEE